LKRSKYRRSGIMEKILILDFGGQYDQIISRRGREQNE